MKGALVTAALALVTAGGVNGFLYFGEKNHECAFSGLLTEIWSKDVKDFPPSDPRHQASVQRRQDYEQYLEKSFFYQAVTRPPHDSYERFKNTTVYEVDRLCFKEATERFEELKRALKQT